MKTRLYMLKTSSKPIDFMLMYKIVSIMLTSIALFLFFLIYSFTTLIMAVHNSNNDFDFLHTLIFTSELSMIHTKS